MKKLGALCCLTVAVVYGWSGKESANQKSINFFGTIETHDGQQWNVQNIGVGRDRADAKYKAIVMYDKPQESAGEEGNKKLLPKNPGALSYSEIDLNEVTSISIPADATIWLYKKSGDRYGIEYLELMLTHKDGSQSPFLIELGREDLPKKTKLFCSIRHTKDSQNPPVIATGDKDELFCKGIKMDELEEKGVPFQAIKKLSVEGFCHQVVVH